VKRRANADDSRINEAVITDRGKGTVSRITKARRKLLGTLLSDWSEKERHDLVRLNRKLANAMRGAQPLPP